MTYVVMIIFENQIWNPHPLNYVIYESFHDLVISFYFKFKYSPRSRDIMRDMT